MLHPYTVLNNGTGISFGIFFAESAADAVDTAMREDGFPGGAAEAAAKRGESEASFRSRIVAHRNISGDEIGTARGIAELW
jgi:hypothetical protein